MKISYDVSTSPLVARGRYAVEIRAMVDFVNSKHSNMCMEYENPTEARKVTVSLDRYAANHDMAVKLKQRRNKVFIIRKEREND